MTLRGTLTLLVFTRVAGCDGGGSEAPGEGDVREFTIAQSCAETDANLCYDYGAAEDMSECTLFGGTVLDAECPTEGRVGSCHSATEDRVVRYYEGDGSGWTAETASGNCNIGPFVEG